MCVKDLAKDPDLYENLTKSIAPSIWQMDDVKRGILCQLFGARSKVCTVLPLHETSFTPNMLHLLTSSCHQQSRTSPGPCSIH